MDFEKNVDETIVNICNFINDEIVSYKDGGDDGYYLDNMVEALAKLVSARAKCREADEIYCDYEK